MSLQSLYSERKSRKYKPGTSPAGHDPKENDLFFLTNYHSLIASLSRLLGVHLRLHLLLNFFVNDNIVY